MAFCVQCGSSLDGRFCAKCGADNNTAAPPPPPPPPPGASAQSTDLPDNLVCALAYLMGVLTGILFLVLEPYNSKPNIRFHAMQSLFFSITAFIVWFGLLLVSGVLTLLPVLGAILGSMILALFGLGMLAVWVLLMFKAYSGETWKLPLLGDLAEKQAYSK
jgi:uncharacterized membrane protein